MERLCIDAFCRLKGDYTNLFGAKEKIHQSGYLHNHNFLWLILEGALFTAALAFINNSTVVPVFINTLTSNKTLVGLAITFGTFFSYGTRLLIGPFVSRIRNHARFTAIIMFFSRPLILFTPLFLLLGASPLVTVWIFIIGYSALWACDGLIVPSWFEVLATTVDPARRGRLLGLQILLGGIAGIAAGIIIKVLMDNPSGDFNNTFLLLFFISGICLVFSCFAMAMVKDGPHEVSHAKVDFLGYFKSLPGILMCEKSYAYVLIVQVIVLVGSMSGPFIILFADEALGVDASLLSTLIIAQLVGTPIGGYIWGALCDKLGPRKGIIISTITVFAIPVLALAAYLFNSVIPVALFLIPAMFLIGASGGTWMPFSNYMLEAVRPESRPSCLVLSAVIILPTSFTSYLAGFIIQSFSYVMLFGICLIIVLLSVFLSLKIKEDRSKILQGS